ncbi:MAG: SufE family protein [Gemmatimonadales bacterium]|nr:MAG: SufE family protein [Gemmatimonadales bacterium]
MERIEKGFRIMPNWEDRYRFLVQLGRKLEPLEDDLKVEANRVRGCASNVWLVPELSEDDPPRMTFRAESDAHIVKGLVALLMVIYSGRSPEEIRELDALEILERLDLQAHLSPSRSNGLFAMVERIRALASAATGP